LITPGVAADPAEVDVAPVDVEVAPTVSPGALVDDELSSPPHPATTTNDAAAKAATIRFIALPRCASRFIRRPLTP